MYLNAQFAAVNKFKITKKDKATILSSFPLFRKEFVIFTSQWKKLSRSDVEIIIKYKIDNFKVVDQLLQNSDSYPILLNSSCAKNGLINSLFAPDEWQIPYILRDYHQDKNYGSKSTCTYSCFKISTSDSPILFQNMFGNHSMSICEDEGILNTQSMTLQHNLVGCCALIKKNIQPQLVTFRKVDIATDLWKTISIMPWLYTDENIVHLKDDKKTTSLQHNVQASQSGNKRKGESGHCYKKKQKRNNAGIQAMNRTSTDCIVTTSKDVRDKKNHKANRYAF